MIGNLFLAVGIACLSASAISTDNFRNVPLNVPVSNASVNIFTDSVVYSYDDINAVYNYVVFDAEFTFNYDVNQNGSSIIGVDGDFDFTSINLQSSNLNDFYRSIDDNNIKFGFLTTTYDGYCVVQFFSYIENYSFTDNEQQVTYFKNNVLKFNVNVGVDNQTYNFAPCNLDLVDDYSQSYYQCYYNRTYSLSFDTTYNIYNGFFAFYPYTIFIEQYNAPIKIRFTSLNIVSAGTYSQGYSNGYTTGFDDGLSQGYQNGYAEGLATASSPNADVRSLFGVLADTPIRFLKQMFNFELFGMNVAVVILSCLTAIVIFTLVKKIWK